MDSYRLVFAADPADEPKIIQFIAEDASEALFFAHKEAGDRSADLWKGDDMLCSIRRTDVSGDEFWEIARA